MRTRVTLIYLLLVTMLCAAPAFSQSFTLDLATEKAKTETIPAGQKFTLTVLNHVNKKYSITTTRGIIDVKLPAPAFTPAAAPPGAPLVVDPCEEAITNFDAAFEAATTEADVAKVIASLPVTCDRLKDHVATRTTFTEPVSALAAGEFVTVTITRVDGNDTLTWTYTATTGAPGEFKILYGFNFIPSHDDRYFLNPTDDAKKFVITRANRRQRLDFAPSMFFTFLTNNPARIKRGFELAPVAGLGFDMSNPVVFGGMTAVFRRNISLNVGVVMHQERRLNGKYNADDPNRNTVTENLTDDQLYEKTYAPRLFFGLGFRFDDNPFAKKNDEKK